VGRDDLPYDRIAEGIVRALQSRKASCYCRAEAFVRQMAYDWRSQGSDDLIIALLGRMADAGIAGVYPSIEQLARMRPRTGDNRRVQAAAERCALRLRELRMRRLYGKEETMVVVAGSVPIKPEALVEVKAGIAKVCAATRKEPGCISYDFSQDVADPCLVRVFERWESGEALDEHLKQTHTVEFLTALGAWASGPPDVKRYVIESVEGL
jgi:quinol monooxygenase YgiN